MRTLILACFLVGVMALGANPSLAAKKKAAKKAPKPPSAASLKQTKLGIEKLMGKYKFGMTPDNVLGLLEDDIRKEMEPQIKAQKEALDQDKLRREMMDKVEKLRKDYVKFTGQRTPWDVSLVENEFAHKNNESMALMWTKEDRRFFLFHNDRLWKIFIAFNTDLFEGKSFENFAEAMESRFGRAERKYTTTISGDAKMDHLAWPPSGNTILQALDQTGFYGNFCLVLIDKNELPAVNAGRKANSPKRSYSDPLIDSVTKGSDAPADENSDVVDRVTGRGSSNVPAVNGDQPAGKGKGKAAPKKQKVDTKDPLKGMDI